MKHLILKKDRILRKVKSKTVLVIRLGAIGDMIMITPVLKQFKKDGYHVVVNCHTNDSVLACNPNIDDFIKQKPNEVPKEDLWEYWKELSIGFDKAINLTGSIEDKFLKREGTMEFNLPKHMRHSLCDKNYMDETMSIAGYDIKGKNPELYFSRVEHEWAKKILKKLKGKFLVLWSLSGSSPHKVWPYTEYVATEFLDNYPDSHVITMGDILCKALEWDHPRTWSWSDNISIRKAMLLTRYADLVIGTETGILNAASSFDTHKIIMLSHSSIENLTKYWKNCESIEPNVSCYPCHQLHYTKDSCKLNSVTKTPLCMTMIRPEQVLIRMEDVYKKSRRKAA